MRHRNSVKQLGKTPAHRGAMFSNMVASFYIKESIITTKQKAKELKKISEKFITRARKNITLPESEAGKKLHNKRIVLKFIKDENAVKKLFDDIAPRYVNRNGGYTRIYHLGRRLGDAAEMALIELVEKKVVIKNTDKGKDKKEKTETKEKKQTKEKTETKEKKDKKSKKIKE